MAAEHAFIAYEIYEPSDMPLYPAPIRRSWMDESNSQFAYRCLPMTLANQSGWLIGSASSFTARWNGGPSPSDTVLVFDEATPNPRILSLFGLGTITFNMPFLFRTPPGINLWVKGPVNSPKDAIHPLEGIVETDWATSTFTMNWKLTRPGQMVRFERWEPICMVIPVARDTMSNLQPVRRPLSSEPALEEAYNSWSRDRDDFHQRVADGEPLALKAGWQKDYFRGSDHLTDRFPDHQTKLNLGEFSKLDPSSDSQT